MVMAKLHVICGNCGCNNDFEYNHSEEFVGKDDQGKQWKTSLVCKNCSTIHELDDNSLNKNEIILLPKEGDRYKVKYPQSEVSIDFQEALLNKMQSAKTESQLHNLLDQVHDAVLEAAHSPDGLVAALKLMKE